VPHGLLAQTVMPFGSKKVFSEFVGKESV